MSEVEDGMGFAGLAPTPEERREDRRIRALQVRIETMTKIADAREKNIARLRESNAELLAALKAQHTAIDILLAMLIERDPKFRPTKSTVWPMLLEGNAAIAKATAP